MMGGVTAIAGTDAFFMHFGIKCFSIALFYDGVAKQGRVKMLGYRERLRSGCFHSGNRSLHEFPAAFATCQINSYGT